MTVKLIMFDLDGTLVDSLADLAVATNTMLAAFGRPVLPLDDVRQLIGQGARRLVERALPGATEEEVVEGLRIFLGYNDAHIADHTTLYPGVPEVLKSLAGEAIPLALVSNKTEALCRKLLEVMGIEDMFVAVVGADSLPFRKPSPEPLLKVLADVGVEAGSAVMVGDSINDIAAGKAAGVITVGCSYGYGEASELTAADFRIDTVPQLLRLPFLAEIS